MGCGCSGKPWEATDPTPPTPDPALRGAANPNYYAPTWPPRGNGPAPKAASFLRDDATSLDVVSESGATGVIGTGGGSGPQTGDGPPLGAVVPASIGGTYVDTTNGGLWIAVGATDADWVSVGGNNVNAGYGAFADAGTAGIQSARGGFVVASDDGSVTVQAADGARTALGGGEGPGVSASNVGGAPALSFYGEAPVVRPVVPLTTPSAQDVIDALVALGLVTQSD